MSEEQAFGREALEQDHGYTPLSRVPWSNTALDKKDDIPLTVDEAAKEISSGEQPAPVVRDLEDYRSDDSTKIALTPKEAGKILSDQHRIEADEARFTDDMKLLGKVLDARGQGDANLGTVLNGTEQPVPADAAQPDGLRPEVKAALELPEVRQAIETEFSRAQEVRSQYEAAIGDAQRMSVASLFMIAPEVAGAPPEHREWELEKLKQTDPQRYNAVQRQFQVSAQLARQEAAIQHQKQQEQAQAVATWAKGEEAKFEKLFPEFADPKQVSAKQAEMRNYLVNTAGFTAEELRHGYLTGTARDARLQTLARKAFLWDSAQHKAKEAVQAPKPPVQRPGVLPDRASQHYEAVSAAEARLKSARGTDAAKAAVKLMQAQRAARGR